MFPDALLHFEDFVEPVRYQGVTYHIGQANSALLYPGLGLGTIVSGASRVSHAAGGG